MKVELGKIVASSEPLGKLMQEKMPIATSFRLAKVLKSVQAELETYDETRKKLIEELGVDGEIKQDSKNFEKFVKEMNNLLAEKVSVKVEKIKSENLSKVEISPSDLLALEWIIDE
jgi:hypothetical protein